MHNLLWLSFMFADLLLLGKVLNFSSGFIVCVHCMKPSVFVKSVHIILFVLWMIALSLMHNNYHNVWRRMHIICSSVCTSCDIRFSGA